jgi:ribonuclease E
MDYGRTHETTMKKEMLINVLQPEECRIAIVEDGLLEELYVERSSQESYVGNIYKGRIVNIEPSIQAAFVDFGIGRNGFLHVSDVDPAYYKHLLTKEELAEYEAEMDREYGGGRSRGRESDRGDRGGRSRGERDRGPRPQPMTSWLEPQEPQPASLADEDIGEFAAGIDGAIADPTADVTPVAEEVVEAAEVVHPPAVGADDDEFTAGIEPEPLLNTRPPVPAVHRPEPPRKPSKPTPAPAEPADDGEFGAGIVDTRPAGPTTTAAPATTGDMPASPAAVGDWGHADPPAEAATPVIEEPAEAALPLAEPVEAVEAAEPAEAADAEPKAKKARPRKPRKADEPAAEAAAEPTEAKGKPRTRRVKKKADGESDDPDTPPDDKPKYMGGAERRTTPGDEPEIAPFFEDASGYDPDAPNDRFAGTPDESEGEGSESAEGLSPAPPSETTTAGRSNRTLPRLPRRRSWLPRRLRTGGSRSRSRSGSGAGSTTPSTRAPAATGIGTGIGIGTGTGAAAGGATVTAAAAIGTAGRGAGSRTGRRPGAIAGCPSPRSRTSSSAGRRSSSRSSRRASAPRGRRCPPTSASPAVTWC